MSAARRRLIAAGIAMAALSPLVVASVLEPSADGLGTHRQLGLPACSWVAGLGLPCPSCGMTTAFSFAARGDLGTAFATQPAGALLAVLAAVVAVVGVWTAATGSRIWELLWSAMDARAWWSLVGVVALAWIYKIASFRLAESAAAVVSGGGS
ncbi:MAG: DUF2752 domain-containing protein [Phycisphaerales bacterium]